MVDRLRTESFLNFFLYNDLSLCSNLSNLTLN